MATVGNSVKSKRPADSAFKQQRLPAWQPILTAGTVLPTFFIIGLAFIPIGVGLLYFSDEVKEKVVDYTNCKSVDSLKTCAEIISNNSRTPCTCRVPFTIEADMKRNVYIYYGLSNFYQNHRRYVKSRDDLQLLGHLSTTPSADCDPFTFSDGKPVAPCGAIANSLFNDTLEVMSLALNQLVPVFKTGIAWSSDKDIKFKNPPGNLQQAFSDFAKPMAWSKPVYELDPKDPSNNGFQNEDLIVWMRTAALPSFRKLYRRVDHSKEGYVAGLPKGNYILIVQYNYGVVEFGGSKRLVISNTSLLGGKNPFLGIAYIVVGGVCLLLALVFLIIHIKCGKSATEVLNVNPNTPYQ